MRGKSGLILILALADLTFAAPPPAKVKALREMHKIDKGLFEIRYKYEQEYLTPAAQAGRRGSEAAKVWAELGKSEKAVAVIARSPFGGGETAKTYWPAGVKAELLRNVVAPLEKLGLEATLPDLPAGAGDAEKPLVGTTTRPAKPWPKVGFSEDYKFVLVIGLHHEQIPHKGVRRTVEGKVMYSRSSRVNVWAILFHSPTATAFWGATAKASVKHRGAADPLGAAAETALGRLDFTDIGSDNIPQYIKRLAVPEKLNALDVAAMLAQTQRADAADAIVKVATSVAAYKNTIPVLRYFNHRGFVQDYRTDPADAKRRKFVLVSQPVMMRVLMLEPLRGLRGVQPCLTIALVPRMTDIEIPSIGRRYVGRLGPLCADDEIVFISELANSDPRGVFSWNRVAAVRNLARCRVRVAEAMAVAKFYADRKVRPPRRGQKPRRDRLKEAGAAALKELMQAKANPRQ